MRDNNSEQYLKFHKVVPGNHLVKFYSNLKALTDTVCDFVVPGITRGDGVIIIGTKANNRAFQSALERRGIDVTKGMAQGQIILLDANEILSKLVTEKQLSSERFFEVVGTTVEEMLVKYPSIRAYGEMVNILLEHGHHESVIELESLWNDLLSDHKLSLLCAYSKAHFEDKRLEQMFQNICCTHSHLTSAEGFVQIG